MGSGLLVLGDSLAFHGPERIEAPTDPRLYPQICAAALQVDVHVVAREGWTARDAWWALTKDPNVYGNYLPSAEAVVIGVGGMDQLPASVPTWLRDSIPYVRPGSLRRRIREIYRTSTPPIIRATGGRLRQLPQPVTDRYLTRIVQAIRLRRPGLPVVLLAPTPYDSPYYPAQRHHRDAVRSAVVLGDRLRIPVVDPTDAVLPGLMDGSANPDGMHWSWAAHDSVGKALAASIGSLGRP